MDKCCAAHILGRRERPPSSTTAPMTTPHVRPEPGGESVDPAITNSFPAVPDPDVLAGGPRGELRSVERRAGGDAAARRAAERRLAAVVEGMSEAFLSLDAEWRVSYANRAACRLNATTRAALVGCNHWQRWPETVGSQVEREYRRVARDGVPARFEHYYAGAARWHAIQAYPAEGGGLAIFFRDVTAERAAAAERGRTRRPRARRRRRRTARRCSSSRR